MQVRVALSSLLAAIVLSGCTQLNESPSDSRPGSSFEYDDRDAIPNDIPLPTPGVNQRPIVGNKKMLVTVVHWQDGDGVRKDLNEKFTLSNEPDSLRSYLYAASGGKLDLSGQVVEFTSGRRPELCKRGSPLPLSLAHSEAVKAASALGIDRNNFDYFINIIDCGGSASAWVPGNTMGVYGQAGGPHVFKHEFGHNLGYHHGFTYKRCKKNGDAVLAPTGCQTILYGDLGDSVSGGGTLYPANNRWYSGWLDDAQAAVVNRTGLYRLGVLGAEGPQLYLINRKGLQPAQLALEYRKPTRFDNFPPGDNKVNGVWVRYTTMTGSLVNTQLDGTPETATTADPSLLPGKMLRDEPAGITIEVCSANLDGATVAIGVNREAGSCAWPELAAPVITSPAQGAPAIQNPAVVSGTARPGASIGGAYRALGGWYVRNFSVVADAKGNWSTTLENLHAGSHVVWVSQQMGISGSPISDRSFVIAP
ncbi:transposase [Pseudomonas fluorescens]|uniref:transposase n=1 Tax=Pseudomonas fluorescens TaxID=294 RepID=UPI0006422ADE|nr:transposase [Pseudomonas fluorescens]